MSILKAPIFEIFVSYQGEGILVGERQIFIRFSGCNLDCLYCDEKASKEISDFKTVDYVTRKLKLLSQKYNTKKISFTGGEPLLYLEFILDVIDKLGKEYFYLLETNGTLYDKLDKIIKKIDIISMDIKLSSYTQKNYFKEHKEFLKKADEKVYVKIVFDRGVSIKEFDKAVKLISSVSKKIVLYIQPMTIKGKIFIDWKLANKLYSIASTYLENVRILPQIHKFLGFR